MKTECDIVSNLASPMLSRLIRELQECINIGVPVVDEHDGEEDEIIEIIVDDDCLYCQRPFDDMENQLYGSLFCGVGSIMVKPLENSGSPYMMVFNNENDKVDNGLEHHIYAKMEN